MNNWKCGKCDGADVPDHFRECSKRFEMSDADEAQHEAEKQKDIQTNTYKAL